jgi:hypothetical protein
MKFACTLILVLTGLASAQDVSQFDLSTNDGVNAAREAISGKKIDERSKNCIQRDRSLPGIVVVGSFAFDRGCRLDGVFVNSRYIGTDDKGMSKGALETLGWKTAKQPQREKLAQAWVEQGLLGFLTVVSKENEHFAGRAFQPPQTVTGAGAETVVTLWIRLPAGRARGTAYQRREYRFSKDGDFMGSKTLDEFTATRR